MSGNQKSGSNQHQDNTRHAGSRQGDGDMTVREAGELGGHKGGQRERELVEKGHEAEQHGSGGKGRH
jgi:hypothetical protein